MNLEAKVFSIIDMLVKLLNKNYDSLIIVSDHGFTQYTGIVGINYILVKDLLRPLRKRVSII
ncbi:MAG: hypothetical protein GSR79_00125 [Desulfurococcales archaeon]|nr:hypothetical protein [Desulfurococcales archaeon]